MTGNAPTQSRKVIANGDVRSRYANPKHIGARIPLSHNIGFIALRTCSRRAASFDSWASRSDVNTDRSLHHRIARSDTECHPPLTG
jgi:hypothetical protein